MLWIVITAAIRKKTQATYMQAYAHGLITSMKVSASASDGMWLQMTASVLFTQCISMVSFNEPVL